MDDTTLFRVRLAETIAWCGARVSADEAAVCLRTPVLQPSKLGLPAFDEFNEWREPEVRRSVVEAVAEERAWLLRVAGDYPPTATEGLAGRLLLFAPDDNLYDGAAELESHGFFDADNIPPWDTWVCYVLAPDTRFGSFLVSWVPPTFLELADHGIWANPEQCIAWADAVDSAFTRSLAAAGLLDKV